MNRLGQLGWILLAVIARACVLLCFSEFAFFNEGPVLQLLQAPSLGDKALLITSLVAFYCLPGVLLLALEPMMTSWPRIILSGAFVGWSIEAAMVPVAYENVPFSYFWTSVFWHAVVDVALGWVLFQGLLFKSNWGKQVSAVVILGVTTFAWSTWAWAEVQPDAADIVEVSTAIALLLAIGFALNALSSRRLVVSIGLYRTALFINVAFWGLWAFPYFPLSAGLAVVAALNGLLLRLAPHGSIELQSPEPRSLAPLVALIAVIPAAVATFLAIDALGMAGMIGEVAVVLAVVLGACVYGFAVLSPLLSRLRRTPPLR